jgi:hypothetical protein
MINYPKFETGDVICVNRKSLFGKLVAWFSREPGEERVYSTHISGFKYPDTISEAGLTVKDTNYLKWFDNHKRFEVWRKKHLTKFEQHVIQEYLNKYKGNIYGGLKLLLFLADFSLTKLLRKRKDIYLFRRIGFIEDFPICSWLYSYAYDKIGYKFGGYEAKRLDPDTMRDVMVDSEEWELIYKKE